MSATHLTDDQFRKTITTEEKPVLVDFYADWCGPCIAAAPIIDKLAEEYQDKILITKLNVDENPKAAQEYGVMSIPTVLIFKKDGQSAKVIGKQIGFPGEAGYRNLIEDALEG
ncbi:MAG TPA: thioredoxin [Patescibacteria group bacterium]|jgi:thioredoxin 1